MKTGVSLLIAAAIALAAPLPAHSNPGTPLELTLSEAVEMAARQAPAVEVARAEIDVARADVTEADVFSPHNPSLQIGAGPRFGEETTPNIGVSLSQKFESGGQGSARLAIAEADVEAAEGRLRETAHRQAALVAEAYLRSLHAKQRLEIARANRDLSQKLSRTAEKRFEAGGISQLDATAAKISLGRHRVELETWQGRHQRALGTLRALLRLHPQRPIVLSEDADSRPLELAWLLKSLEERPEIRKLRALLRREAARQELADSLKWPDVTVGLRYGVEEGAHIIAGALAFTLPVWVHGQGTAHRADALGGLFERRLATHLEKSRAIIHALFERYQTLRGARDTFENELLPVLERNQKLTERAYDAGSIDLTKLLTIRRETIQARESYTDLLFELNRVRVELEDQAGTLAEYTGDEK